MSRLLSDGAELPSGLVVERSAPPMRSYVIRTRTGEFVASFSYRDALTLVAVRAGLARAVWRRRHSGWGGMFIDEFLEPECDVFGIGHVQLTKYQDAWGAGVALVTKPKVVGLLELTEHGNALLDAIVSLDGVEAFDLKRREEVVA